MTTPNYPYGEPNNNGGNSNDPFNANQGEPYGAPYGESFGPSSGAQQSGYQDPYGSGYTGGFENSPLNAPKNTAAAWALGLGIASIVTLVTVFGAFLSPFLALAGVIVAIIALVKAKNFVPANRRKGFAITGLILSILTLILLAIGVILILVVFSSSGFSECATLTDPAAQEQCIQELFA